MTKIYLIRHAAAEGNLYRVAHGQFNSTITAQGYRQLSYLRHRFAEVELAAVYGSDLLRAHTTAAALYVPRNLPFRPEPRLREVCMGAWEQLTWGEVARLDAEMYYNFNHRPDLFAYEGAESFTAVRDRMRSALRDIAAAHPCVDGVELLPFRKMCQVKYDEMGLAFPFAHLPEPTPERMAKLNRLLR